MIIGGVRRKTDIEVIPLQNFIDTKRPEELSEDIAAQWINFLKNLIDTRIEHRIAENDLVKVYDAKITSISDNGNEASLACNDMEYNARNCTGIVFTNNDVGKWVKMITYDKIQYFILHKIDSDTIDTDSLKKEILEAVSEQISN